MADNFIPIQNITNANLNSRSLTTQMLIGEEKSNFLPSLQRLKDAARELDVRLFFKKDLKSFKNPDLYTYLPVYQEGYVLDEFESGKKTAESKALVTWGTQDCVVIAAFNPLKGIYMTHALYTNSFFRNRTSTANDEVLRNDTRNLRCEGIPIADSLPSWISDPQTQLFMYSQAGATLLNRIRQLRTIYSGPITAYLGSSYDGSIRSIRGITRNRPANPNSTNNIVRNERIAKGSDKIVITNDGFFGNLLEIPSYLDPYMKEVQADIERKESISNQDRRCVYNLPSPISREATPVPTEWRMALPGRKSPSPSPSPSPPFRPISKPFQNPFEILAIGGKTRRKPRRRSSKKTRGKGKK